MIFVDDDNIEDTLYQAYQIKIGKYNIEIPEGFRTDYASIPRFLLPFFIKYQKAYKKSAVIHDWLYWQQKYSRATADKIFYDAMYLGDIPKYKRKLMYWAVRVFGYKAWNENKEKRRIRDIFYKIAKVNKSEGSCNI